MAQEPTVAAPAFQPGQPVEQLVLPVAAGSYHDRAMPLVVWLAERWNLPIRVVHVAGPADTSVGIGGSDGDPDHRSGGDASGASTGESAATMPQSVVADMQSWYPSLAVTGETLHGDRPGAAIARYLDPRSLAVLSTDNADAWSFKNSVAEELVHLAEVPVLLVGPKVPRRKPDGEIVVGYDGSASARIALDSAVSLARATGHRLWMVRVVPEPLAGDDLHESTTRPLQELAEQLDAEVGARWEVVQSNSPVDAISSFADRRQAGFIVVGSRSRTDTSRRSMSSIAMGLVSNAEQPVLVTAIS